MYPDPVTRDKLPELKFIRHILDGPKIKAADSQKITVEARVVVKGQSWCLLKWYPSAKDSEENSSPDFLRSWIQERLIQEYNVLPEKCDFPPNLNLKNEQSKSGYDPNILTLDKNVIEKDLADTVVKYLTSDMDVEGLISVAKEAIKFSPEELFKLDSKFGLTKTIS